MNLARTSRQALLLAGRDESTHAVDPPFPYPGPLRHIRSRATLQRYLAETPTSKEGAIDMGIVMLDSMRGSPKAGSLIRHEIGGGLLALYVESNKKEHLLTGIAVLRKAFTLASSEEAELRPVYESFFAALSILYGEVDAEVDGGQKTLEELITCTERMFQCCPTDDKIRQDLVSLLTQCYSNTGHLESLERAICLLPDDDPKLEPLLSGFCDLLFHQHKASGDRSDLLRSFTSRKRWVSIDRSSDPTKRVRHLITLVRELGQLNGGTLSLTDLKLGIQWCEDAARFSDIVTPEWRLEIQSYLVSLLFDLARTDYHPEEVERAVQGLRNFLNLAPQDHRFYISKMDHLITLLTHRAETLTVLEARRDIEEAVTWAEKLVDNCKHDHPRYMAYIHNVGVIHHSCYLHGVESTKMHLQRSLDILKRAEMDSASNEFRPVILSALATTLGSFYEADKVKYQSYLERSLNLQRESVKLNKDDPANWIISMRLLGATLRFSYSENAHVDVLNEAISVLLEALGGSVIYPSEHHLILRELCGAYHTLFARTHNTEHIRLSIQHGRDGLQLPAGSRDKAQLLDSLSNSYYSRFEFEGESSDLDESIRLKQRASLEQENPLCANYLIDLADRLRLRCFLRREKRDVDEAIKQCLNALKLLMPEDKKFPYALSTMGYIHQLLFEFDGEEATIKKAIKLGTEASGLLGFDHDNKAITLNHVSHMFLSKYEKWYFEDDLLEAIRFGKDSLALIPATSIRLPMILINLSSAMHAHTKKFNTIRYEAEITDQLSNLLSLPISRPLTRVRALRMLAQINIREQNWLQAFQHLSAAINLYPMISPRAFTTGSQQESIRDLAGVAQICASCGLNAGCEADPVLEILEAGRGIMAGWIINAKNDISRLADKDSDLAARYIFLRDQISDVNAQMKHSAHNEPSSVSSLTKQDQWRSYLYELEDIERKVRFEYADLKNFQRPLTAEEIKVIAQRIPIVEINSTVLRSDAFIVTGAAIASIQLPQETYEKMGNIANTLLGPGRRLHSLPSARSSTNEHLRKDLKWLYQEVVLKIMTHLGFSANVSRVERRLVWVSNGAASFCPLHAADAFSGDPNESTSAHVVSSYIPSLKALQFSRESTFDINLQGFEEVLVVAMPQTKGQTEVSAEKEAQNIATSFSRFPKGTIKDLPSPSRHLVLEGLKRCAIAHFACHGFANNRDPSRSCLLLADSMVSGKPDELAAADLNTLKHSLAKLCYLSACSTAENPAIDLTDENIHIASAFQLSGFAHVIGTLWEARDEAAVDVARVFYDEVAKAIALSDGKMLGNGHDIVAFALHKAVDTLKSKKRPGSRLNPRLDVLSWAPFIHLGP